MLGSRRGFHGYTDDSAVSVPIQSRALEAVVIARKWYRKLRVLNFVTFTVATDPPRAAPTLTPLHSEGTSLAARLCSVYPAGWFSVCVKNTGDMLWNGWNRDLVSTIGRHTRHLADPLHTVFSFSYSVHGTDQLVRLAPCTGRWAGTFE